VSAPEQPPQPGILLTLAALPDELNVPMAVRIRKLIKTLRRHRLKCVKYEWIEPKLEEKKEQEPR